jgi:hypothetical protein
MKWVCWNSAYKSYFNFVSEKCGNCKKKWRIIIKDNPPPGYLDKYMENLLQLETLHVLAIRLAIGDHFEVQAAIFKLKRVRLLRVARV